MDFSLISQENSGIKLLLILGWRRTESIPSHLLICGAHPFSWRTHSASGVHDDRSGAAGRCSAAGSPVSVARLIEMQSIHQAVSADGVEEAKMTSSGNMENQLKL